MSARRWSSVSVSVPYGLYQRSSGVVLLLARGLACDPHRQVQQLRCNGFLGVCERDALQRYRRDMLACFTCNQQADAVASWIGAKSLPLGAKLTPQDVELTRAWGLEVERQPTGLARVEFEGVPLAELVEPSFSARTGALGKDLDTLSSHERQLFMRFLVSGARVVRALRNAAVGVSEADALLVDDGREYLSQIMQWWYQQHKRPVLQSVWDSNAHVSRLVLHDQGQSYEIDQCPFVCDDLSVLRADPTSWPRELSSMIRAVLGKLG